MSSLTPDERAALHSYVVANTVNPSQEKDISLVEQDLEKNFKEKKEEGKKEEKTYLERLIEERNAKRRKEGKKVHINRKSHLEIIREVIENQMEIYIEWLKDENLIKKEEVEPGEIEQSDHHCEEDVSKGLVKKDRESTSYSNDYDKSLGDEEKKQRFKEVEDRVYKDRRTVRDSQGERRKQNEQGVERDYYSRSNHPRDSRNKRHGGYESTLHREFDKRNYREHDYKRHSGKYYPDDKKGDYGKCYSSKRGGGSYWDDGYHVPEEDDSDKEFEVSKSREKHDVHQREGHRKHGKEHRYHKSKRQHHSGDNDSGSKSKHSKKEKGH